jgi:hypothetical protein
MLYIEPIFFSIEHLTWHLFSFNGTFKLYVQEERKSTLISRSVLSSLNLFQDSLKALQGFKSLPNDEAA